MNPRKPYFSMQLALAVLLPIVLLLPASAHAATVTYIGSPGGDWNTPGNWSGGAVPGPGDTAVIGGTNVVIGSTPPNPGSVEIGPSTRIDVDAGQSLTVENSMSLVTTCQSCGGIQFFGPGSIGFASGATLSIALGPPETPGLWGQLQLHEGMTFTLPGPGAATSWTAGTFVLEGAFGTTSLVVPAGATFPLLDGGQIGASTTSDRVVNQGTIVKTGPGTTFFGANLFNSGLLEVEQGTLTAHAGAFPLVQEEGRTVVRGGSGACTEVGTPAADETFLVANVTLNGGTLEGDGGVHQVTNNGGTVDPGAAGERGKLCLRGNYTQGANGTLRVDINGAALGSGGPEGYDRLAVGQVATLDGTLAIVNDPSFVPQQTDVFTILTRAVGSGTFGMVTGAAIPAGTYEASYAPTGVNLGFVPNPPENNGPVAVDDAATVEEDSSDNAIDVLANDSDPDGDPLTIAEPSDPPHGAVTCSAASCSYTPDPGYDGPDAFTYSAEDDKGARSKEATVSITVTPLNNSPVAVDDAATVDQDSSGNAIDVLTNDSDPDGDPLTIAEPSDPPHGAVTCTAASCSYTPDPGYAGPDAFTYSAEDDKGARSKEATVSITVTPATATLTVVKDLIPSDDPGRFDLVVTRGSSSTPFARLDGVGDGGTLGPLTIHYQTGSASTFTISEHVTNGGLDLDYSTSISCVEADGIAPPVTSGGPKSIELFIGGGTNWTCTFTNTRLDTTPPVVTVPADITVDATGKAGATVSYTASASDDVDPSPSLTCVPASGSVFPIGTTTVTCIATDDAGNSASATFSVHVRDAGEQIVALIDKTLAFLDLPSLGPVLKARLTTAANALIAGNKAAACTALNLYKLAVQAAPTSAFTPEEKSKLIADANRIRAVIGC